MTSAAVATRTFETADPELAAFLCMLGYDQPQCDRRTKGVVFVFERVRQEDVLGFINNQPAYLEPLSLFRTYKSLCAQAKMVALSRVSPYLQADVL